MMKSLFLGAAVLLLSVAMMTATVEALPSFSVNCSIPIGPVDSNDYLRPIGSGTPGPAYAHHGYLFSQNVFFIVGNGKGEPTENSAVYALFPNCTSPWSYYAPAPIVAGPMTDGQIVLIRTYDANSKTSWTISLNSSTGRPICIKKQTMNVASVGSMTSAVHDGRMFIATYDLIPPASSSTKQEEAEVLLNLTAYHAETCEFLYSWTESNLTSPWEHGHNAMPAPDQFTNIWMTYNPEGDRGFIGFGARVVSWNGVTGWRTWDFGPGDIDKHPEQYPNPYHYRSFSASAQGGSLYYGTRYLFIVWFNTKNYLTCMSRHFQVNGSLAGQPVCNLGYSNGGSTFIGAPAMNKYSDNVCLLYPGGNGTVTYPAKSNGGKLVCWNATSLPNMTEIFPTSGKQYENEGIYNATPSLGFTEHNYILTNKLVKGGTAVQLDLLDQTTGVSVFNSSSSSSSSSKPLIQAPAGISTGDLVSVGYVSLWDNSYDYAMMAVGKKGSKGGAFWVGHIKK